MLYAGKAREDHHLEVRVLCSVDPQENLKNQNNLQMVYQGPSEESSFWLSRKEYIIWKR